MSEPDSKEVKEQKEVAYYSSLVNAWVQTKMERDKVIVSLSAGGIGLLVTILGTVGVSKVWQIYLYGAAFLGFILTLTCSILIFDKNSKHIEDVLNTGSRGDYSLKRIDKWSLTFFVIAVLFSISIGCVTAFDKFTAEKKGDPEMAKTDSSQPVGTIKSLDGIGNLAPGNIGPQGESPICQDSTVQQSGDAGGGQPQTTSDNSSGN